MQNKSYKPYTSVYIKEYRKGGHNGTIKWK